MNYIGFNKEGIHGAGRGRDPPLLLNSSDLWEALPSAFHFFWASLSAFCLIAHLEIPSNSSSDFRLAPSRFSKGWCRGVFSSFECQLGSHRIISKFLPVKESKGLLLEYEGTLEEI